MLRCSLMEFPDKEWDSLLPYVEMYYNGTASASTSKSPHEIVYGTNIRMPSETLHFEATEELLVPPVEAHLERLRLV